MTLDFSSLRKSIVSLEKAAAVYEKYAEDSDSDLKETLSAGVIQNFEFTYELSWKFMKRWIDINIGNTAADGVTRRELFRLSAENRLIDDVEKWMVFHKCRNLTSHLYDEEVAGEVLEKSLEFARYAKKLLVCLEGRNT